MTLYSYTNEYIDSYIKLIYLRSRMYDPLTGRFTTKDSWQGDYSRPLSLNRWNYVEGNPVNYTDPTGHIKEGMQAKKAELILEKLKRYNVYIKKDWGYALVPDPVQYPITTTGPKPWICEWQEGNWRNAHELELTYEAIKFMAKELGGPDKFRNAMKGYPIDIKRYTDYSNWAGFAPHPSIDQFFGEVMLFNGAFNDSEERAKGYVVHELAHVWDFRNGFQLSDDLADLVGPYSFSCVLEYCTVIWDPDSASHHFPTEYSKNNKREFWADVFKVYLFPRLADLNSLSPMVENYVQQKIATIP